MLRTMHGNAHNPEVFVMRLTKGRREVAFERVVSPSVLRMQAKRGHAEICIPEPRLLRVHGHGVGLRLRLRGASSDNAIPVGEGPSGRRQR